MYIKDRIPTNLQNYPNVSQFADVLDGLQQFKQENIANSLRAYNMALLMDNKWLLKRLGDYGITDMPIDYPLEIVQQFLLNADTIFGTRGSKIGIELYCSVLSLGEVTVDDSAFYHEPVMLLLDSTVQGYITEDNSSNFYCLVEDTGTINPEVTMNITIKSKFFNGNYPTIAKTIQNYIKNTIGNQLGFSPNKTVNISFSSRNDFYYHKLLNSYFV